MGEATYGEGASRPPRRFPRLHFCFRLRFNLRLIWIKNESNWRRRRRRRLRRRRTKKIEKNPTLAQTIDQVMTIKTHTELSKTELSSGGKRPFKVWHFFLITWMNCKWNEMQMRKSQEAKSQMNCKWVFRAVHRGRLDNYRSNRTNYRTDRTDDRRTGGGSCPPRTSPNCFRLRRYGRRIFRQKSSNDQKIARMARRVGFSWFLDRLNRTDAN